MEYPSYLIHYNKNHSKANGQFVSGDGDGDGIANDHAHRSKTNGNKSSTKKPLDKKYKARRAALIAVGAGVIGTAIAGIAVASVESKRNKGKTWYEKNKSYQDILAREAARKEWTKKYQPEGWDKDVKFKTAGQIVTEAWDKHKASKAKLAGGDW